MSQPEVMPVPSSAPLPRWPLTRTEQLLAAYVILSETLSDMGYRDVPSAEAARETVAEMILLITPHENFEPASQEALASRLEYAVVELFRRAGVRRRA